MASAEANTVVAAAKEMEALGEGFFRLATLLRQLGHENLQMATQRDDLQFEISLLTSVRGEDLAAIERLTRENIRLSRALQAMEADGRDVSGVTTPRSEPQSGTEETRMR